MNSTREKPYLGIALLLFFVAGSAVSQAPAGAPPQGSDGPSPADGNRKVVVATVSFKGNAKFSDATLLKVVDLHVGEPMSRELIKQALDRLITYYRSHGANLSVSPNIDPNGGQASVQFVIDENGAKGDAGSYQPPGGRPPGAPPPGGGTPP